MANDLMLVSGLGLVTLALTPTPDDITIISPLLQLTLGGGLILSSFWVKN